MNAKLTAAWNWLRAPQRMVWAEYTVVSLAIMLPLLTPGYILTLDLVFTPHLAWSTDVTNTYPLQVALWVLYQALPGDVIEEIVLFLIFVCAGAGMHRLAAYVCQARRDVTGAWQWAAYVGGLLYMINPFVYSRLMAGQWMVLLGYALVPFFVLALLKFVTIPSGRSALRVGVWAFVIATVSLHHVGMVFVIGLLALLGGSVKYRSARAELKRLWVGAGVTGIVVSVLSSFWLVPAMFGVNTIGRSVAGFDAGHFDAFATLSHGPLGAIGEVIRLQGFWVESRDLFILPQQFVPMWGLIVLLLWVLVAYGGIKAWRQYRFVVCMSIGCIVAGVVLAATPLLEWAGQLLPVLRGYREPQKFVNLIALGYCLLGAFGAGRLLQRAQKRRGDTAMMITVSGLLLLPLAITPTMLWGGTGQLTPRHYPQGWYDANEYLKTNAAYTRTLFLPWHQYTNYSFSGRIIANPAAKFFTVPMIISDEPEFADLPPTTPIDDTRRISELLRQKADIARTLADMNVGYVLLAKEGDAAQYAYLQATGGLQRAYENQELIVYKVEDAP